MRRDMDLIRTILIEQAKLPPDGAFLDKIKKVDNNIFAEHVRLLIERGLVEGSVSPSNADGAVTAIVTRLTWNGQDLVSEIENEKTWKEVKKRVISPGVAWSFDVLKEVLKSVAMKSAGL